MNSTISKLLIALSALMLSIFITSFFKTENLRISNNENLKVSSKNRQFNVENNRNFSVTEKVIYTCQATYEESPASEVQITEVSDTAGNHLGIGAHVYQPEEFHFFVEGAKAEWGYSVVSATSNRKSIKFFYNPKKIHQGYNWVLVIKGDGSYLKQRIKKCREVSDE